MKNVGKDLSIAANALINGGVVAFPTETVMGLGVIFNNKESYERLNKVKGRPEDKPYTLMVANIKDIEKYAELNDVSRKLINKYMPGPLTILLKAKDNVPSWVTHKTGIIGVRVPNYKITNDLLNKVGVPLLVPSANPSGMPPATDAEKVFIYFKETIDYIIDYKSKCELPSTIVDATKENIKILREGSIKEKEIIQTLQGD